MYLKGPELFKAMEERKMRKCPFCGCDDIQLAYDIDLCFLRATCTSCGAKGPSRRGEKEAIKDWDKRKALLRYDGNKKIEKILKLLFPKTMLYIHLKSYADGNSDGETYGYRNGYTEGYKSEKNESLKKRGD